MIRKIGISTGGGDCPGLNAVIRAVVRTAKLHYQWDVIGIEDGFDGLIYARNLRYMTVDDVHGILPRGGTILGTTNRGNPFKHLVVENGKEVVKDMSPLIVENIRVLGLDAIVCIGGDGSLSIARDLFKMGVPVVGVPKTIDNDLSATDLTFGFTTAVDTATEALDRLHTTAESHHRVMVVEVMGRDAGWIALESGIAGAADVILLPEIPFDIQKVCDKVKQRRLTGRLSSIIVAAEGAAQLGGDRIVQAEASIQYQNVRLGGIGQSVARQVEERTGIESRVVVLGHLQRGGSPNAFDRILGTRYGVAAVELIAQKQFGYMVCLHGRNIDCVEIERAVGQMKRVDPNGQIVTAAEALGTEFGRPNHAAPKANKEAADKKKSG
ncbi:MAG: ATP-dependent 6-phosphofructokinase [Calditrichaeota bacterium]|nr:ATP-dependent 6-phosphofructokinase [Calditrichota bacterium]